MVALAAQPILTTIGRVAVPKLADTLVRTGANKFVKQYGQKAFEAVLGTTAGLKAYKETEEYLTEYLNHIDSGGDEGSFVPKGSMPGTDRMTQMDAAMAVPNVNRSVRETGQGLVIGGEAKEILPPPEPFSTPIDSQTATILSTPIPEKVDTTLSTPIPKKIDTTLSTPIPEPEGPQIYYNKDDELKEGLAEYEEIYNEERFAKANKEYPKYDPANTKKIVEADKHFGAISLARKYGNDADNIQLIYISPDEYLNLATEMNPDNEWSNAKIEYLENKIIQGKEIGEIPILFVGRKGEDYNVKGHEGRHRVQAFKNAGYDKIPVRIEGFGKDKENNVENKLYTATKRSYLYNEEWAQEYIGFVPKRIVTERLKNGSILSGEEAFSINLNSEDFYDVLTKEKLFKTNDVNTQTEDLVRGIGDNNPPSSIEEEPTDAVKQTDNILGNDLSISTTLDDKLLNDLLVMRGGIEGFNKKMSSEFAPMPGATKSKMEIILQEKLFDKYNLDKYPEGKTSENSTKEETDAGIKKYNTQLQGIEYIVSVAYDAIGEKGVNKNINYGYPIFTLDNEGLPVAGAKIKKFKKPSVDTSIEFNKDNPGARIKNIEALYITEMGSINSNATTKLLNKITEIAKENKIPYVVVEDLTSEEALKAFKKRGYEGTLKKEYKPFIGRKIQRPYSNRLIRQKNLVLKLPQ